MSRIRFLPKVKVQFCHLGFFQKPSISAKKFHWKLNGFLPYVKILIDQQIQKVLLLLNFMNN